MTSFPTLLAVQPSLSTSLFPLAASIPMVPTVSLVLTTLSDPVTYLVPTVTLAAPIVYGTVVVAVKMQDDTQYQSLERMDIVCSHYGALHWMEVI